MKNNYIGIFDSGIGGLTTLKEIRNLLPNENYYYYADRKNNPYGSKSDNELYSIVKNNVTKLIKLNVKLIVIACNTATTKCIDKLREDFNNIEFIGTEPAIKLACDKNYKNILVMATPATVNSIRTRNLININKKNDQNITLMQCDGLANAIEMNDNNKIDNIINKLFKNYNKNEFDAIVLGCTHYPYIKDKLLKKFPKTNIIDGNLGVAKRVKYILETNDLLNNSNKNGNIKLHFSCKKTKN